jgi:hemerythrin-like domain-containing protein
MAGTALLVPDALSAAQRRAGSSRAAKEDAEEVAPPEDLMREHGVLKRVLLVYDEAIRRIDAKEDLPPDTVRNGAAIIRTFIEDYHEKLEEDHLFPRFEKAGRLTDLTRVLRVQHQAGRRLTELISRDVAETEGSRVGIQAERRDAAVRPHVQPARGA